MTERLVHHGRLTTRAGLGLRGALLIAPALAWLGVFLFLPGAALLLIAFTRRDPDGGVLGEFSTRAFQRLAGYGALGWSPDLLNTLARTLAAAAGTSLICVGLAYPVAFALAWLTPARRRAALSLLAIPLAVNLVVRTQAWELTLAHDAPLAAAGRALGMLGPGEGWFPSALAVMLGLVSCSLPFAVLPLWTAVQRLDPSLIDAARDLYGSGWRVFRHALLPQTRHAAAAAAMLTFFPTMGVFVLNDRLGGGRFLMLGNLIYQQFTVSRDYPLGAALCLVPVAVTLLILGLTRRRAT
jgi:spermidine/putrescine transport system permease protein